MRRNNSNLNKAKGEKFDEFYAIPAEIAKELNHYHYEFKGKTIFCNCNDGLHRGFVNFFIDNFDKFDIGLLIYSLYGENDENGKIFTYNGIHERSIELKTKGDFRNGECLDALKHADIIVTGPPFSLFREFINKIIFLMEKYNFPELKNFYYGEKNIHQEYEWCLRAMRKLGFKFRHIMNMFNPTEDDFIMMETQEIL